MISAIVVIMLLDWRISCVAVIGVIIILILFIVVSELPSNFFFRLLPKIVFPLPLGVDAILLFMVNTFSLLMLLFFDSVLSILFKFLLLFVLPSLLFFRLLLFLGSQFLFLRLLGLFTLVFLASIVKELILLIHLWLGPCVEVHGEITIEVVIAGMLRIIAVQGIDSAGVSMSTVGVDLGHDCIVMRRPHDRGFSSCMAVVRVWGVGDAVMLAIELGCHIRLQFFLAVVASVRIFLGEELCYRNIIGAIKEFGHTDIVLVEELGGLVV